MSSTTIDDSLAREASGGDERALGKIFRDYHQPLYRYCLVILGNRQDAEDALQETMIKVLRALPGERREITLKPWLYRIAHNESIDLLRRRRSSVSLEQSEPTAGEGLAEQVETRQRLRQLIVDLGALPERQRGALLMREAGGLSFEEIAAALETSPAVARQTLYEARLGLREMDAGRDMDCTEVTQALSDGDGRVRRRRDIRAHLRDCGGCRLFAEEIDSRRNDLAAISPLPVAATAALLHGVLTGGAGAGSATAGGLGAGAGSGAGGMVAGAAAKSVGSATLLKGMAAVAVVAAIGVGAADRGGLVHLSPRHHPAPTVPSAGGGGRSAAGGKGLSGAPSDADSASGRSSGSLSRGSIESARATSRAHDRKSAHNVEPAPSEPAAGGEEANSPSPGRSGVEYPHGRGHAKQTPAAAAHGEETAGSSKPERGPRSGTPGPGGSGGSKSVGSSPPTNPTHPSHPVHPTHPSQPSVKPEGSAGSEPPGKSEGKKPK